MICDFFRMEKTLGRAVGIVTVILGFRIADLYPAGFGPTDSSASSRTPSRGRITAPWLVKRPVFGCQDSLSSASAKHAADIPDLWFGKDKARHLIGSFLLVGATSRWYGHQVGMGKKEERIVFGMGVTLVLGVAKEVWDGWSGKGQASWKDLAADVLGLLAGACLLGGW
jgi:putative lipoprotein